MDTVWRWCNVTRPPVNTCAADLARLSTPLKHVLSIALLDGGYAGDGLHHQHTPLLGSAAALATDAVPQAR
jgi:hypothetical protein